MTLTIDSLRHKEIRITGLVTMMDGYLCLGCGKVTHQLLYPKLAMEEVAKGRGPQDTALRMQIIQTDSAGRCLSPAKKISLSASVGQT
jgi:hypothetical protein